MDQNPAPQSRAQRWVWLTEGYHDISAYAVDKHGRQSEMGHLSVYMPKNKAVNHRFLNFLQQHPNLT